MSTYAGYQKFETPDIGSNAANMLIQKQQMDAKKAEQGKEDYYKNLSLGIQMQKQQMDALSDRTKEVDAAQTGINNEISKVPITGFSTLDGASHDWTVNASKRIGEIGKMTLTGQTSIDDFNQVKQSYRGEIAKMQKTGTVLKTAHDELAKTKNPNKATEWYLNYLSLAADPNDTRRVQIESIPAGRGVLQTNVNRYEQDDKGGYTLTSSVPLDVINNIATVSNFEAQDYMEELSKVSKMAGPYETQIKNRDGGRTTIIDKKKQDNYQRVGNLKINSIINDPSQAADAYMKLIANPYTNPVDFIMEDTPSSIKQKIALSQGHESVDDAQFITWVKDKNGMHIPKLSEDQRDELKTKLTQTYNDMAGYSSDTKMPSVTNVDARTIVSKEEQGLNPMFEGTFKGDIKWIDVLKNKMWASGNVVSGDTYTTGYGDNKKTFKTFHYDEKSNTITVAVIGKDNEGGANVYNRTINLNDPTTARLEILDLIDASKEKSNLDATLPYIRKTKQQ